MFYSVICDAMLIYAQQHTDYVINVVGCIKGVSETLFGPHIAACQPTYYSAY
jgi:hypothetical protein